MDDMPLELLYSEAVEKANLTEAGREYIAFGKWLDEQPPDQSTNYVDWLDCLLAKYAYSLGATREATVAAFDNGSLPMDNSATYAKLDGTFVYLGTWQHVHVANFGGTVAGARKLFREEMIRCFNDGAHNAQ